MTRPLSRQTVHMVGRIEAVELQIMGADVSTLCGKVAAPTDGVPSRYILTDSNGNNLLATTRQRFVSCKKCINLLTIGVLHVNTPRKVTANATDSS